MSKEIGIGEMPTIQIETTEDIPEDLKKKLDEMGILDKVEIKKGKNTVLSVKEKELIDEGNGKVKVYQLSIPFLFILYFYF